MVLFFDFPDLLKLQQLYGAKMCESYSNDKQSWTCISFNNEEQRHKIEVEINVTDFSVCYVSFKC